MSNQITRRDFLKVAGLGTALTTALTGCGPAARYVRRQPYSDMPEYNPAGQSVYYATTCGECAAGCGLIARTFEGRAKIVNGNPAHPVSHGNSCARGQATVQGLYNPDRLRNPLQRISSASEPYTGRKIEWKDAIAVVQEALQKYKASEIAFILGLFPDHLNDLVQTIAKALGGAHVVRHSTLGEFEQRITLMDAAQKMFGVSKLPFFDIERAEVTFSFGANFSETWLSPVAYSHAYGVMRRGHPGQRGYLVQFEPRMSQTAANADEWFPINPGTEGILAQALDAMLHRIAPALPGAGLLSMDLPQASEITGVPLAEMERLARMFLEATRRVAIPGAVPLGASNGLETAQAILALNMMVNNLGQEGGVYLMPDAPLYPDLPQNPSSSAEMLALIEKMNSGQIKAVFIHGFNPVYGLPASFGFAEALAKAELAVSFASVQDETVLDCHYALPDHTPLESWGYQKVITGADRVTVSGLQPVVTPLYDTMATADVLLAAVQAIGGELAKAVPYTDEVDFLQQSVATLNDQGGIYTAPDAAQFWLLWLQHGGWWKNTSALVAPTNTLPAEQPLVVPLPVFAGEESQYEFILLPYPSPNLADGAQANRPVLQETPDPTTTVMWNSWVEMNLEIAHELGLHDGEVLKLTTPAGSVEATLYVYPGLHPHLVAVPLGQGHTAFGRYAEGRGINALALLGKEQNSSGSLATLGTRVKVEKTGKDRPLARYESRSGIYRQYEETGA